MFWILFIGCLFIAIGDGKLSDPMSSEHKELEAFFNNLFFHTETTDALIYFNADMEDVHGEIGGNVVVGLDN